jgi:hypothetical protein
MTETAVPQGDPLEAGRGLWSEVCRDGTQATQPLRYTAYHTTVGYIQTWIQIIVEIIIAMEAKK